MQSLLDESGVGPIFWNKKPTRKKRGWFENFETHFLGVIGNLFFMDFVFWVQEKFWLVKLCFFGFHLKILIILISIVGFVWFESNDKKPCAHFTCNFGRSMPCFARFEWWMMLDLGPLLKYETKIESGFEPWPKGRISWLEVAEVFTFDEFGSHNFPKRSLNAEFSGWRYTPSHLLGCPRKLVNDW